MLMIVVKRRTCIVLFIVSAISLLLPFCSTTPQKENPKVSFREVKDKTLIPEGIAVSPSTGKIYLSSLHENKIVAMDDSGGLKDVITKGQDGFMWGLGMKFSQDGKILWACSADGKGKTALYAIDHAGGRIVNRYMHDSARFFNDLVILNDGRLFITDTEVGALFLLQKESISLYLKDEKLKWANGIAATPNGNLLFVASARYGVMKIDTKTKSLVSATNNRQTDYAVDGLVLHKNELYGAIGWPQDSLHQHRIIRYRLDDQFNFLAGDTLGINQDWLQCPTTLALYKDQLFALSVTNLGIYNRHQQQVTNIMDSLRLPVIGIFDLR